MKGSKLKTVRFTAVLGDDGIRFQSDGSGRSGEYVPAEIAEALLAALKAFGVLACTPEWEARRLAAVALAEGRSEAAR